MTKKTETSTEQPDVSPHDGNDIDFHDTKDLTESFTGLWPSNPSQRQGSFFINLNRLDLKEGQTGLIGSFPEGFVFERVDVYSVLPNEDKNLEIAIMAGDSDDKTLLGIFGITSNKWRVDRRKASIPEPGYYAGSLNIYLKAMSSIPESGRIMISIVGYKVELWR